MYEQLGEYKLIHQLSTNGATEIWSTVRIGYNKTLTPCLLKIVDPGHHNAEQASRHLLAEVRICSKLRNRRIVKTRNATILRGRLVAELDYIDGTDLRSLLLASRMANHPLSIYAIEHIIGELLEALDYTHNFTVSTKEQGIIHGDIHPRNILITSRGEVLLGGFGSSPMAETVRKNRTVHPYMANEQITAPPSRSSDLYAVGAILHELLTGEPLYPPNPSRWGLMRARRKSEEAFTTPLEEVPTSLLQLRAGLLEEDIARRISSAEPALDLLNSRGHAFDLESLYTNVIGLVHSGLSGISEPRDHTEHRHPQGIEMNTPRHPTPMKTDRYSNNAETRSLSSSHAHASQSWRFPLLWVTDLIGALLSTIARKKTSRKHAYLPAAQMDENTT